MLPPFSSEVASFDYPERPLPVYRLAFGQPRWEDLVAFLGNPGDGDNALGISACQLDLSPPDFDIIRAYALDYKCTRSGPYIDVGLACPLKQAEPPDGWPNSHTIALQLVNIATVTRALCAHQQLRPHRSASDRQMFPATPVQPRSGPPGAWADTCRHAPAHGKRGGGRERRAESGSDCCIRPGADSPRGRVRPTDIRIAIMQDPASRTERQAAEPSMRSERIS